MTTGGLSLAMEPGALGVEKGLVVVSEGSIDSAGSVGARRLSRAAIGGALVVNQMPLSNVIYKVCSRRIR
jgi:hypothetical protein